MACSTLARVAGLMCGWSLMTRETVWCETPANRATSPITGARAALRCIGGTSSARLTPLLTLTVEAPGPLRTEASVFARG